MAEADTPKTANEAPRSKVAYVQYDADGKGVGDPIEDFADYPSALAQAKAIGDSVVTPVGTAFHVGPKGD